MMGIELLFEVWIRIDGELLGIELVLLEVFLILGGVFLCMFFVLFLMIGLLMIGGYVVSVVRVVVWILVFGLI